MFKLIVNATAMLFIITILTGLIYPIAITGIAQVVFPSQAEGSLIKQNGEVIGSELIGQNFNSPKYFHGRPSNAGDGYDAANSSGSNLGPTNQTLKDNISKNAEAVRQNNDLKKEDKIAVDLVTSSASGLDPHISPEAAYLQIERVAKTRKLDSAELRKIVDASVETRDLGILGEPRVNVLKLNLTLDKRNI